MLSVLDIISPPQNNGIKERWRRLVHPSVTAYMQPVGNTFFLKITCEQRNGRIDWKAVRSYSLDCMDRILLPENVQLPEKSELRRFVPFAFNRRMLENLALNILSCSAVRPELRRVAVYGQDNEVAALLPRLCRCAGEVRVVTRRPYAVADTVEQLRGGYGAGISVTDEFDAVGFDLLLAPAGGAKVFSAGEKTVVLSPDRPSVNVGAWIRAAEVPLPEMLVSVYDSKYNMNEFVGAFYEAAEIRELGRLIPDGGVSEHGFISSGEAANLSSH